MLAGTNTHLMKCGATLCLFVLPGLKISSAPRYVCEEQMKRCVTKEERDPSS